MFDDDNMYEDDYIDPYEEAWNDWDNEPYTGSNPWEYYSWDEEVYNDDLDVDGI